MALKGKPRGTHIANRAKIWTVKQHFTARPKTQKIAGEVPENLCICQQSSFVREMFGDSTQCAVACLGCSRVIIKTRGSKGRSQPELGGRFHSSFHGSGQTIIIPIGLTMTSYVGRQLNDVVQEVSLLSQPKKNRQTFKAHAVGFCSAEICHVAWLQSQVAGLALGCVPTVLGPCLF